MVAMSSSSCCGHLVCTHLVQPELVLRVCGSGHQTGVSRGRAFRREEEAERVQLVSDGAQEGQVLGSRFSASGAAVPAKGCSCLHVFPPSRPSAARSSLYSTLRETACSSGAAQARDHLFQVSQAGAQVSAVHRPSFRSTASAPTSLYTEQCDGAGPATSSSGEQRDLGRCPAVV